MNPKILPLTRYDIIQVMLKISKVHNWMQIVIDDIILWKKIPFFGFGTKKCHINNQNPVWFFVAQIRPWSSMLIIRIIDFLSIIFF